MNKVIRELLLDESISHTVVKCLMVRYTALHVDPEECVNSLAEIIADIREPITAVEEAAATSQEARRQVDLRVGRGLKVGSVLCFLPGGGS